MTANKEDDLKTLKDIDLDFEEKELGEIKE
jgi:hypothetical protein